jgi:hypothetical protein
MGGRGLAVGRAGLYTRTPTAVSNRARATATWNDARVELQSLETPTDSSGPPTRPNRRCQRRPVLSPPTTWWVRQPPLPTAVPLPYRLVHRHFRWRLWISFDNFEIGYLFLQNHKK